MDETAIRKLVDKYLSGICTDEEKVIVEAWYKTFDNQPDSFVMLSEEQKKEIKQMMFGEIKSNIQAYEIIKPKYRWLRYAAGIAAVFAITLTLVNNWKTTSFSILQKVSNQKIIVANTGKSILRVLLPDSSTIWLQPGSEVTYPEQFGELREVVMKGDVFFEVHKDANRPFIVHSAKILTRVLGTSFRVRALENDPMATVSVLSGKVSVKRIHQKVEEKAGLNESEVLLLAEEKVSFSEKGMIVRRETGSHELDIWKKNSMSFDNAEVREVLEKLNTAFGVKIEVSSEKINRYVLKADFSGMNLPDILEILESSLNLIYEIDGNRIILKPID